MEVLYESIMTIQTICTWRRETGNDGDKDIEGDGDDNNDEDGDGHGYGHEEDIDKTTNT